MRRWGMSKIKAVRHGSDGSIEKYRLGNGDVITRAEAVRRADKDQIEGVHSVHPEGRPPFVRANPNRMKKDNLENLPEFRER
jgi:hypothetical protein